MPRPRIKRRINFQPSVIYFKPAGVPLRGLTPEILGFDEVEALRLKDLDGLDQEQAAKKMQVSRTTFLRMINKARNKIAKAIIKGKPIRIEGGDYIMPGGDQTGPLGQGPFTGRRVGNVPPGAGIGRGAGRGMGRPAMGQGRQPGGYGMGPGSECVCLKCDYKMLHQIGFACNQQKCPKCGTLMTRAEISNK